MTSAVVTRSLGLCHYDTIWQQMKHFTRARDEETQDEIWLLEHYPVFTQGQAGKAEHVLAAGDIPIIHSDRGGQVTYHGPGQLIMYFLTDIRRKKIGIRCFVSMIEQAVINLLDTYGIEANSDKKAPGVYVNDAKVCSLGLRVSKGRTYHGLSLNVAMDLEPFTRINPCGYTNLKIVQTSELGGPNSVEEASSGLLKSIAHSIGYNQLISS